MAKYTTPSFSRTKVDKAGERLRTTAIDQLDDASLEVIGDWRAAANFPLNTFYVTLDRRVKALGSAGGRTVQRLKRLPSIQAKLRTTTTRLTQMQDIGGCRAVVRDVVAARSLVDKYLKTKLQNYELFDINDYVAVPKPDGYRSIHLVFRYKTASSSHATYNGIFVEAQFRSELQHSWATAVEIASTFLKQSLKGGSGDAKWRRFFLLMSSAIASREGTAFAPGTATSEAELLRELRDLSAEMHALEQFAAWGTTIKATADKAVEHATTFLLRLDMSSMELEVRGFADPALANQQYAEEEKAAAENPNRQTVLVSAKSLATIRKTYTNYWMNTTEFIVAVQTALKRAQVLARLSDVAKNRP